MRASSRRTAELAEMKKQLEKHALDVEALINRCPCCYCDDWKRVPSVWLAPVALMPNGNMKHAVGSHSEGRAIAGSH